jgi:hypothetical protein
MRELKTCLNANYKQVPYNTVERVETHSLLIPIDENFQLSIYFFSIKIVYYSYTNLYVKVNPF